MNNENNFVALPNYLELPIHNGDIEAINYATDLGIFPNPDEMECPNCNSVGFSWKDVDKKVVSCRFDLF